MGRSSAQGRRNGVRPARLTAELTQAELAEAAGVSRQTVVAIEAGDYAPSVYLALALADRLGRTVEDLFEPEAAQQHGPGSARPHQRDVTGVLPVQPAMTEGASS